MQKTIIDINLNHDILTPEETAQYLRKSTRDKKSKTIGQGEEDRNRHGLFGSG